ncbi:MAG: DNA gyrase inhibitor YacG [Acidobacteria bacterium]|nr:MAG: DNA gyrase inhibitor YacG [Acidobacteriota bacterium]REJ99178.1 MAG: DNA gyrase inhibitor YacG [Acidobacteriota bacterium]REK16101.1 MAG: DNA gyrase inhibitor YacG [Acidobacteriota bacterium]REK43782.1 MAG: DNA gyrase inhibitor YacG [Acidobacteriota bacterium]
MPLVKCPGCGKRTEYLDNEFRPFCSERCKLLDFGDWADGKFALPAEPSSLTDEDIEAIERARSSGRAS